MKQLVFVHMCLLPVWIDLSISELSHLSLWLDMNRLMMIMNRFMLKSYPSSLSRIIKLFDSLWIDSDQSWIDSDLHLGSLNHFTCYMTCINPHNLSLYLGLSFLVSESIQLFNESIHSVIFMWKLCLVPLHYI